MSTAIWVILGIVVGAFVAWLFARRSRAGASGADDSGMKLLLEQMNDLRRTMDTKLGESQKEVTDGTLRTLGMYLTRIFASITDPCQS